eukprot:TRINITY_DN7072_c0_g1_i14.p1 TRINITY_DN7072_c0_g1~~TRINITY_DN7072_c0_g1_i14.p1  ORF type:complete len:101 (-),score=13.25 TRINITY_DN7072_c0_g1_i14:536-838(-)
MAVNAVHAKQSFPTSREELYKCVENLVDHNMSQNLYNRLELEFQKHVQCEYDRLLDESRNTNLRGYLTVLNNSWVTYCQEMVRRCSTSIFIYNSCEAVHS